MFFALAVGDLCAVCHESMYFSSQGNISPYITVHVPPFAFVLPDPITNTAPTTPTNLHAPKETRRLARQLLHFPNLPASHPTLPHPRRMFARSALSSAKVAVLGAAGGIGQPLSLLCKLSPYVDTLSCYDVVGTPGVAADLSHCPTKSHTTGSLPDADAGAWPEGSEGGLKAALEGGESGGE